MAKKKSKAKKKKVQAVKLVKDDAFLKAGKRLIGEITRQNDEVLVKIERLLEVVNAGKKRLAALNEVMEIYDEAWKLERRKQIANTTTMPRTA